MRSRLFTASSMGIYSHIWERIYGRCHNISQFKAMIERWQCLARMILVMLNLARMVLMMLKLL